MYEIGAILIIIFFYFMLTFRQWLFALFFIFIIQTVGLGLSQLSFKRNHLVKLRFDGNSGVFLAKQNSGNLLRIPLENIERVENYEEISMREYGYVHKEKNKNRYLATMVPYEVDERIQEIKRKHQQKPNHEYIKKNSPNNSDTVF